MLDSNMQSPNSGMPEFVRYLVPKAVWMRYGRSYSAFMKRLKKIVRKGGWPKDAFKEIPQENTNKREYFQALIHPILGIEYLDRYFRPRDWQ